MRATRQSPETTHALALADSGMSLRAAADQAGVALSTLVRARARAGATPRISGPAPRDPTALSIGLALIADGMSVSAAAREAGVPRATLNSALARQPK